MIRLKSKDMLLLARETGWIRNKNEGEVEMGSLEHPDERQAEFRAWVENECARAESDNEKMNGPCTDLAQGPWGALRSLVGQLLDRGWGPMDFEMAGGLLRKLGRRLPLMPVTADDYDADGKCARYPKLERATREDGSYVYRFRDMTRNVDWHIRDRATGELLDEDEALLYGFDPNIMKDELRELAEVGTHCLIQGDRPVLLGEIDPQLLSTKPPYTLRITHVVTSSRDVRDVDWTWVNYDGSGFTRVSREEYDKAVSGKSSTTGGI